MVYRYYIAQTTASGELLLPELPYPYIVYRYGKQGIKFDGIHAVLYGYAEYQGELMESTIQQFGLIAGESPKYYPIDEESARLAHEMMSLRDYVEGSRTAEYRRMVDQVSLIAYRKKRQTDRGYHEKIDRLADCYAKQLAENLNNDSRIGAMCPSILISGGSNFPVRKKERQNAARERNMRQYQEIQKIIGQIKSVGRGGISSDDPNALEKLKGKLESLEKLQAVMKEVNAYYRKHKTLDGCPHLSEGQIQKCRAVMESSGEFARELGNWSSGKPLSCPKAGILMEERWCSTKRKTGCRSCLQRNPMRTSGQR